VEAKHQIAIVRGRAETVAKLTAASLGIGRGLALPQFARPAKDLEPYRRGQVADLPALIDLTDEHGDRNPTFGRHFLECRPEFGLKGEARPVTGKSE
jgi:hypothetical protein